MIGKKIIPHKTLIWIFVLLVSIWYASTAGALELPGLKSLGLPSFKYGKLERDREINQAFQTYRILPNHTYYTSGRGDIPFAIIGVQDEYELRPGLWQKIELTTPLLRSWIPKMDNIYGYPPYGSAILDNNGKRIGIWYSSKQWTTVIIENNNEIAILAPETPGFRGGK